MSTASTLGPKLCGDALAIKGDLCVTGSLLPENAIELWSIKVRLRKVNVIIYLVINSKNTC